MVTPRSYEVAIVAAAPIEDAAILAEELKHYQYLVAVDGGLQHCADMKLTPDVLIGDLDSVDEGLLKHYPDLPIERFPKDKHHSDLDLALQLDDVKRASAVTIFAATGGRIDHSISNLMLLVRDPERLAFETENERIFLLPKRIELELEPTSELSLMPLLGPVEGVSTQGLHWDLTHATLDQELVSLSNRVVQENIIIEHEYGNLLCILFKNK